MIWKQFLYNFMVLLNGPVKNALFFVMDRYRMFAFGSGQGAVGFQRLELTVAIVGMTGYSLQGTGGLNISKVMVSKLGTRGHHCKQLQIPKG